MTPQDWLATPYQRLAEITAGAVFHDEPGELSRVRTRLTWYPHGMWRYVLSCQCSGSRRKKRSPVDAPRRVTNWAPPSSPPGWLVI